MFFYTHRYIVRYGSFAPGPHVFALQEFIYSKVFDKSEMLPAIIEKDDIEQNFEKFDEEIDSIDQAFQKIEGKFERLRGKRGARKTEEDSSNSGSESGSKKPKCNKNLDSDYSTDYHKSNEESESSLSEEKFEKGFDVKSDWYVRKSDRKKTVVLKVLYIIKDYSVEIT